MQGLLSAYLYSGGSNMTLTLQTVLETLTPDEERDRLHLERKVERALYEQGKALQQLRDRKLYRSTHSSWETYLRERFDMGRHYANNIIAAIGYVENIARHYLEKLTVVTPGHQSHPEGETPKLPRQIAEVKAEMVTGGHQTNIPLAWDRLPDDIVLPTKEKQIRAFRNVPEERHGETWEAIVNENNGRPPSGPQVEAAVRRLERQYRSEEIVPNPFTIGQACIIRAKNHPDQRSFNSFPAIVLEANEYTCQVKTGLGEHLIPHQALESLDITAAEEEMVRKRLDRLARLSQVAQLDPLADRMIRELSKQSEPYLSPFQEQALLFLEEQHGLIGEAEAESPAEPELPSTKLLTSAPTWAREIEAAEAESSELGGDRFFVAGDPVRVREPHQYYPGQTGIVAKVYPERAMAEVHLQGIRKETVMLPFAELVKTALPAIASNPMRLSQEGDSG